MDAAFRDSLIHRAKVLKPTKAQTSTGAMETTFALGGTIDPFRFVEKTERVADEKAGFVMLRVTLGLCGSDEDVYDNDRICCVTNPTTGGTVTGGTYTIESRLIRRDEDGPHHMSLQLERVM